MVGVIFVVCAIKYCSIDLPVSNRTTSQDTSGTPAADAEATAGKDDDRSAFSSGTLCEKADRYFDGDRENNPIPFQKGAVTCECSAAPSKDAYICVYRGSYIDPRIALAFKADQRGEFSAVELQRPIATFSAGSMWGPCDVRGRCDPTPRILDQRLQTSCRQGICDRTPGTLFGKCLPGGRCRASLVCELERQRCYSAR
jgi:hypothetical protein